METESDLALALSLSLSYTCTHKHTPSSTHPTWIRPFAPASYWIWRTQHEKVRSGEVELSTTVETLKRPGLSHTEPARTTLCRQSTTDQTEASSVGPNRDSRTHGQLGPISDCLYHLLCVIKYHWVLKKRLLEVSRPFKWQGDSTPLL